MLTLQQMIDGVLRGAEGQALSKIAQAADEYVEEDDSKESKGDRKPPPQVKREAERRAAQEEKAQGGGQDAPENEDTDMERVEKMASAIEEVVQVLLTNGHGRPVGRVVTAADGMPENATLMSTNQSQQAEAEHGQFGEAKKKIPASPPQEKVLPAETGQSAMATDEEKRAIPAPAEKIGSLQDYAASLLYKSAADPSSPQANIGAAKSSVLPEDRPLNAPLAAGQEGLKAMLASNEAAMNITKRKAKAKSKQDLAGLLSERALSRSTDKALDQTLGAQTVDQAGAKIASERKLKIAAARALISKIASEGCTCSQEGSEKGSCRFCKVASRLNPKSCAPKKQAMVGDVQGASNVPSTVESSPAPTGGMNPPQM